MGDLEKSKELYQLFAERFSKDPFGDNQAAYWNYCLEILKDADSEEEATRRLMAKEITQWAQIAPLYDDINCMRHSATLTQRQNIVDLYNQREADLKTNPKQALQDVTIGTKIGKEEARYNHLQEHLLLIFTYWVEIKTHLEGDETESAYEGLKSSVNEIIGSGETIESLLSQKRYQGLLFDGMMIEKGREMFLKDVGTISSSGRISAYGKAGEDLDKAWKMVKNHKSEIMEAGREELEKRKRGAAMAIAPKTKEGIYEFTKLEWEG